MPTYTTLNGNFKQCTQKPTP